MRRPVLYIWKRNVMKESINAIVPDFTLMLYLLLIVLFTIYGATTAFLIPYIEKWLEPFITQVNLHYFLDNPLSKDTIDSYVKIAEEGLDFSVYFLLAVLVKHLCKQIMDTANHLSGNQPTFTFTDEALPANRKHTQAIFAGYIRRLRKALRRECRPFKYIYTIEGEPVTRCPSAAAGEGNRWEITPWREGKRWEQLDTAAQDSAEAPTRLHTHCFLHLRKEDYEAVRSLWPYGQVYISQMKVNELTTFQRLANYVTKESRAGAKGNGARAYTPSTNLEQPVESGHWCSEFEGITLPMGAEKIASGADCNEIYGSSTEYLSYRMPRETQQPQPYKSKGKVYSKKSRPQS